MGIGGGILNNTFMTLFGRPMHQAVAHLGRGGRADRHSGHARLHLGGLGQTRCCRSPRTGFVNWIAVALIIPITLVVAPYGVRIAHWMQKRHLEIAFGIFCLVISARFFISLL